MIDDIKKTLWATADKLRANMDAAEYKHLVLGLIFVKYISDTFQSRREELTRRFADPKDDYFLHDADAALLAEELEDRDYYREVNVFWVPETARWESLRANAKQSDIGKRIDDALSIIEVENPKLKGILDKRYARAQLPDGKLGELVDLVSQIGFGVDASTAVMCSVKFTNISLACSPVQKASVADSSTRQQASLKRWLLCWLRIMARYMTRVVVLAVCLCSLSVSSKPTVASWAMSASTAKKPTPPHGDWRQ
jgi:type I restriction-modification system DNA methylase subunit